MDAFTMTYEFLSVHRQHPITLGLRMLTLTLLLLLANVSPLWADEDHHPSWEEARQAVEAGRVAPLEDLLTRVAGQFEGRVLKVELEGGGEDAGTWIYAVKLLTPDGQVWKLKYQAHRLELMGAHGRHERGVKREALKG